MQEDSHEGKRWPSLPLVMRTTARLAVAELDSECGQSDLAQLDTIGPGLDAEQFRFFRRRLEEDSPGDAGSRLLSRQVL